MFYKNKQNRDKQDQLFFLFSFFPFLHTYYAFKTYKHFAISNNTNGLVVKHESKREKFISQVIFGLSITKILFSLAGYVTAAIILPVYLNTYLSTLLDVNSIRYYPTTFSYINDSLKLSTIIAIAAVFLFIEWCIFIAMLCLSWKKAYFQKLKIAFIIFNFIPVLSLFMDFFSLSENEIEWKIWKGQDK